MTPRIEYLIETVLKYRWLLIVPTVTGLIFAFAYVFLMRSESWTTRQRLIIRDDLLGQPIRPGQFSSLEAMQSRQETILEIARSPEVIRNVMSSLGPSRKSLFFNPDQFPDQTTIESIQGMIRLAAPNGGEFGKSETVVLSVRESSAQRSFEFIQLLVSEVEKNAEHVRRGILASMEVELGQAKAESEAALNEAIQELKGMEQALGIDSLTMANIASSLPSDTTIRQEINTIETEKRILETLLDSLLTSQRVLEMAIESPELLVSGTTPFLKEQVKLGQLASSIVQAQGTLAERSGRYNPPHPSVRNAAETLELMKRQLNSEIESLQRAIEPQIAEARQRSGRLQDEVVQRQQRLRKLADLRGKHIAINSEVTKRAETLNQLEANLTNVRSSRQVADGSAWFSRVGAPQISARPDGLSKKGMVLAGGCLGFLFGCGVLMIIAPPLEPFDNPTSNSTGAYHDSRSGGAGNREHSHRYNSDSLNQDRRMESAEGGTASGNSRHQNDSLEKMSPLEPVTHNRSAGYQEEQFTTSEVAIPNLKEKQDKQLERLEKLLGDKRQKCQTKQPASPSESMPSQSAFHPATKGASAQRSARPVVEPLVAVPQLPLQDPNPESQQPDATASQLERLKHERARATDPLKHASMSNQQNASDNINRSTKTIKTSAAAATTNRSIQSTISLQTANLSSNDSHLRDNCESEVDRIRTAFEACQSTPFVRSID